MNGSNLMHWWMNLVGSLATIALILTALGVMLGIVKPADVLGHIAAILGIVMLLLMFPGLLMCAWSGMSLWDRIGLVAIGIGAWQLLRPRRQQRKGKKGRLKAGQELD
jgi:hypothetical protein